MRLQVITILLSLCSLTACSSIPLSPTKAQTYTNIETFITKRFNNTNDKAGYGTANWRAIYNDGSSFFLSKPSKELKVYCQTQGGQINYYPKGKVKLEQMTANSENNKFLRYRNTTGVISFYDQNGELRIFSPRAKEFSYLVNPIYVYEKKALDILKYHSSQEEIFGIFTCSKNDKPIWLASISVDKLIDLGSPNNLLDNPKVLLKIEGYSVVKE